MWDCDTALVRWRFGFIISLIVLLVLSFENKITQHRDYFDAGEMFYENIPILEGIIRFIKSKMAN